MASYPEEWLCVADWWFDLGISYNKTYYHHTYRRVVTIAVAFFSIYIRWKNK